MNLENASSRRALLFNLLFSGFFLAVTFFVHSTYGLWIAFSGLTTTLGFVFFFQKDIAIPSVKISKIFLFIFLSFALVDLMNGSHLVEWRWLLRFTLLFFTFFSMQFFSPESCLIRNFKWAFLGCLLYTAGWSFYQYIVDYDPYALLAHQVHASIFHNISHYSQAMLASLPFLVLFYKYSENKTRKLIEFLIVLLTTTIVIGIARSTILGLIIFFGVELIYPSIIPRKKMTLLLIISVILSAGLIDVKTPGPIDQKNKQGSLSHRKVLIDKAISMSKDYPAGVGVDNYAFTSYFYLTGDKFFDTRTFEIPRSPHNEPLRILAEEGWGIFLIYCATLVAFIGLAFKNIVIEKKANIFYRFFLCMIPEVLFHFPSEMFLPSLLFGLAFAVDVPKLRIIPSPKLKKVIAVICFAAPLFVCFSWTTRNEPLFPIKYASAFCTIYHDEWETCREYFKKAYLNKRYNEANEIVTPILKYQPYNFYFLALDYSLGVEPRSKIESCLFYNLFNGLIKIPDSDVSACAIEKDRNKVREAIMDFSMLRQQK